jgi:hypothetical protein
MAIPPLSFFLLCVRSMYYVHASFPPFARCPFTRDRYRRCSLTRAGQKLPHLIFWLSFHLFRSLSPTSNSEGACRQIDPHVASGFDLEFHRVHDAENSLEFFNLQFFFFQGRRTEDYTSLLMKSGVLYFVLKLNRPGRHWSSVQAPRCTETARRVGFAVPTSTGVLLSGGVPAVRLRKSNLPPPASLILSTYTWKQAFWFILNDIGSN